MNERIKQVREMLDMSQRIFAEKMCLGRDVISNVEYGRTEVKDYVMKLVCNTFNVSENWLRTGEGEVFVPSVKEDFFTKLISEAEEGEDEFVRNFVLSYMKLSEQNKKVIRDFTSSLSSKQKEQG